MGGRGRTEGAEKRQMNSIFVSRAEEKTEVAPAEVSSYNLGLSSAVLTALGDESSRKILGSAIASGKTVEDISAEQGLPLSTCYRRMRTLLSGGLMILERTIVTPAGKRYAIYRTSFSKTAIRFDGGEITVELTPNMDIIDKLRRIWLTANYPLQNQDDRLFRGTGAPSGPVNQSTGPFE